MLTVGSMNLISFRTPFDAFCGSLSGRQPRSGEMFIYSLLAHPFCSEIQDRFSSINISCLRHLKLILACLNLFQCLDTPLTNSRVTRRLTHARRIVPTALAFFAVGAGDSYVQAVFINLSIWLKQFDLRNDEHVTQIVAMTTQVFVGVTTG